MRALIKKYENYIFVIVIILIASVTLFVFSYLNNMLEEELDLAIDSELDNLIAQQKLTISSSNETNLSELFIIANLISDENVNPDYITEFLNAQMNYLRFSAVYYIDEFGNGISNSGQVVNFRDNEAFNYVISEKTLASSYSEKSDVFNSVMDLAVPVIRDGIVSGVLLGEIHTSDLLLSAKSYLGDTGYVKITTSTGATLTCTSDKHVEFENLNNDDVIILDGRTYEDLVSDFANGTAGTFRYNYNNITKIVKYEPLGINNYMLAIAIDELATQTGLREISRLDFFISMSLIVLFAILVTHVFSNNARNVKKIEQVFYYDELTGLPNLTKVKSDIQKILLANRDKQFAILKVDVTNFKAINEIYGYEIGNKVLCAFRTIASKVPEKSFIIARVGIDEFVFFSGNGFVENVDELTSSYESQFKLIVPEIENHHLTFHYGRYIIDKGETDINDIYNKVSLAHTMAKNKKDCVIWDYDNTYKEQVIKATNITNRMKTALDNGEFCAFLQPKVELRHHNLIGAEALVRWIEPDGKMIFPNDFIPVLENNGFIVTLDMYILECVCKLLKKWKDNNQKLIPISVNFSRLHLSNVNFAGDVKDIVDKYEIPHKYIEIEITETTVLENEERFKNLINALHDEKFKISIDDFGTGYSSLGLLKEFKLDTIKLDRSFIMETQENERKELIVDGIVKLAHGLEMSIIAEGVEDLEQAEFLSSIECEAAQGYFFAKPMPMNDFEKNFYS